MDLQNRKLKKNLEYAADLNIPYVVILGSDELDQNKLMLRDLRSGEQGLITINELPEKIKI
jgi:histidyl-tRNA synthetase